MATRVTTLHTHYDNLKVARDASPAAIDAAYQAMVRRFGPGHSAGDPQAARKMAIIDTSYAVLSNPHQRALHDLWVDQNDEVDTAPPSIQPLWMHSEAPHYSHATAHGLQSGSSNRIHSGSNRHRRRNRARAPATSALAQHLQRNWSLYALGAVVACLALVTLVPRPFLGYDNDMGTAASGPLRGFAVPVFFAPRYQRPATDPNGQPWPASAGYLASYPQLNTDGAARLTVDNSHNDCDMFVKLVSLDGMQPHAVRHLYVPAFRRFAVEQLSAGRYEVRYRNLATGALARSSAVAVQEAGAPTDQQGNASSDTGPAVALHKQPQGNPRALQLAEADFF